jgi:drug/metabolite transporter (DMT)-like permease
MLIIVILVAIATTFSKLAFDKNLNRYLWGTIGVVSYFLAQFLGGIIISAINPEILQDSGANIGYALLLGFIGVGIAYFFLHKMPYPDDTIVDDSDLLDDKIE